jgi:hypothetical protein
MGDDIIEIKPGVPGLKLNVRALLRHFSEKAKTDPVSAVAYRFLYLFQEHGVPVTQIPRLLPNLALDKLKTAESLLPHLTGDVLDQAASLFRVRREWIEGATPSVYDSFTCYKQPEKFFEALADTDTGDVFYPIRALFSTKTLDMNDGREQPITILFLEKVADLADEQVLRYRICCDQWDWGYWKCRIQLKAMARLVDKELRQPIPLYRTDKKTLEEIREGNRIPSASILRRPVNEVSLDDFACAPEEHAHAKDSAELPSVLDYIKNTGLETVAHRALAPASRRAQAPRTPP